MNAALVLAGLVILGVVLITVLVLLLRTARSARRPGGRPGGLSSTLPRRYTTHVRERMGQRRISAEEVETVLAGPDRVQADAVERSMRFEKVIGPRLVKVWVTAEHWPPRDEVVIKSAAAQYFRTLQIRPQQVGRVIGRGGATIRHLQSSTQSRISIDQRGRVQITAGEPEHVTAAVAAVITASRTR